MLRLLLLMGLLLPLRAAAYAVLTHQANIDSTWDRCIVPTLERRYPGADSTRLVEAKAYAYGGAIVQDMGYYPFGKELFTNLTHYVRSGDFVRSLLGQARNRNEYAFALGALAHYAADINGHREGTNRAMASVYPELAAKYGPVITYEEAPIQHSQLEFAFDVVQLASGRYHDQDYHKAIGFKVSRDVLERAFRETYGLELGQITANVDLSVAVFRFSVNQFIPMAARAAWNYKKKEIRQLSPKARRRDYLYRHNARAYRREFGGSYDKPGWGAHILSYFVRVLPKIGPLKPFAFKVPTPEAEKTFRASFRLVMKTYCQLLARQPGDSAAALPRLPNTDFDTGVPTKVGEYALADETYGEWLRALAKRDFKHLTPTIKANILDYFDNGPQEPASEEEKEKDERRETQAALARLRAWQPAAN